MCECCLTGLWCCTAANNRNVAGSVVRAANGRHGQQVAAQNARNRVYAVNLEHLIKIERREYRGKCTREHGFAGAGRARKADVVAACGCDNGRAFCRLLPADVLESKLRFDCAWYQLC